MKKTYQVNSTVRFVNRLTAQLIHWGIARPHGYLLTVRGRKTGKLYSVPVTLVESDGKRWLVAPYGEVSWVRNARAAGEVTLTRGRKSETLRIREVPAAQRGSILKQYVALEPIVLPYFESGRDSPLEAFTAEAGAHPVFELASRPMSASHLD